MRLQPIRQTQPAHPLIHVIFTLDRQRAGKPLAEIRCFSNTPLVNYTEHAKELDEPTFSELTRSIRSGMRQIKDLPCMICGRRGDL